MSGAAAPGAISAEVELPLRRRFAELRFSIPSEETALPSAIEMVKRMMAMLALDNDWISRTEICLQEALLNAHFHGNHGDRGRGIHVACILSAAKVELDVEDEGSGYETNRDFSTVGTTSPKGRGLFLIRQLMDSVAVNSTGNHIVMVLKNKESDYGNQCYADG